jgi:hypothetical protein
MLKDQSMTNFLKLIFLLGISLPQVSAYEANAANTQRVDALIKKLEAAKGNISAAGGMSDCELLAIMWRKSEGKNDVPADCCSSEGITCSSDKKILSINWRGKGLKKFVPGYANLRQLEEMYET